MKFPLTCVFLTASLAVAHAEPPKEGAAKETSKAAESQPISTDRPDFVESSLTVGKGHFQVETSTAFERVRETGGRVRTQTDPTLFRIGVSRRVELRVETEGFTHIRTVDSRVNGASDTAIGFKIHTQDGEGSRPSMAWLFHVDMPSGTSALRGYKDRPSARVTMEWELSHGYSLGVMPGVFYDDDPATGRFFSEMLGVTVGKSLRPNFRIFGEVAAEALRSHAHGGNLVNAEAGAAYLLGKNLQLDAVVSQGVTRDYRGTSWGIGLSRRY